ncbi:MAG TPA: rod shape-determining protein RodA [Nitrospiria bacterium]|nr:rod shape-determining protein RodA [Candidatus Manganitrophaceae bacterium]HIL35073.1 rod shape-determining protein RodA [Candidatus Manganitrophaceae bacterium]
MVSDRRMIAGYDWLFLIVLFIILGLGVLSIYSVTTLHETTSTGRTPLYMKQIYWIILGWVAFLIMAWIDYHEIIRFAYPIYAGTIVMLALVPFIGRVGMGAQRWIQIGSLSFQPSEVAKISILLALAKYFSDYYPKKGLNLKELMVPAALLLLPMVLILKQPDLGTALSISSIFFSMLFVVGLKSKFLINFSLLSAMLSPFIGQLIWNHLKDYQKKRLLTFINPANDPTGTGYQIIQSKIAIGSGGLSGKGLFGGTQSQLQFLPERHTDFIFSVFAEQWGFLGILFLFLLFLFLFSWTIEIATRSRDILGSLIVVGVIGLISFYVLVNIGMTLGVMPVVGVPLPLFSYGGTAMVSTMALLGLLLNVKLRRFMLFY